MLTGPLWLPAAHDAGTAPSRVTADLNGVLSRVNIALNHCNEVERDLAAREVPVLLADHRTLDKIERLAAALAGGAGRP